MLLSKFVHFFCYVLTAVMMAARSLIQVYRHSNPELLHKKDRVWIWNEAQFLTARNMLEAIIFTPGLVAEELVLFEDQTGNQEGRGCVGVEGPRSFSSLFTDALIQRQVMIFSYLLVNTLLTMKVISGQNTSESLVDSWRLATICLKRIGKKSI